MNHSVPPGQTCPSGQQGLEIREQPQLPLATQVEICADGIHHRLFRSLTTLVVVALAVAFLMNMLTESAVISSCKPGVGRELSRQTQYRQLISLPKFSDDGQAFQRRLAELKHDSLEANVFATWMSLSPREFSEFQATAIQVESVQEWFSDLSISHRRLLFETAQVENPLALLQDQRNGRFFSSGCTMCRHCRHRGT